MAKSSRLSFEEKQKLARITGLDYLREFIPDSDYTDSLIEHAASGMTKEQRESDDEELSPEREAMLDRSRAVLTYLRDNGYNFSVQADNKNGEIKAKLETSNIEIRILDTDANAQYIGRVYNDGVTYNFSKGANAGRKDDRDSRQDPITNITPEMTVDLVKYALGEDVNRRVNTRPEHQHAVVDKKVGETVLNGYGVDYNNYQPKSTSVFTALYEERTDSFANGRKKPESIYIRCVDEKRRTVESFNDSREMVNGQKVAVQGSGLEKAERYVQSSMEAAERNFTDKLKLEAVDKLAELSVAGEFEGEPEYSDDARVADMQKAYYDQRKIIYSDKSAYPDAIAIDEAKYTQDEAVKNQISEMFGNQSMRRINPVNVSAYMDDSRGMLANEDNLLSALRKINRSNNPQYDLEGEDFSADYFKERMIDYNPNPTTINGKTYPMNIDPDSPDAEKLSPFWREIGSSVREGLTNIGVQPTSIHVDENGVIHYEGGRTSGILSARSKPEWKTITGDIGQVFEPDDRDFIEKTDENGNVTRERNLTKGLIETKFNSGNNYYIAPGYTAYIVPPSEANGTEGQNYVERTRLRGYMQEMSSKIKSTLKHDLVSNAEDGHYDNTAGLNSVYHHLYGDKKSLDFVDKMRETKTPDDVIEAIVKTSLQRVKYDKHFGTDTSVLAHMNAKTKADKANRGYDPLIDNVKANIAIPDHSLSKNIFDPYATGTGTNQGVVRYLTEDAVVNPDGTITPGKSEYCSLINHENFKYTREGNNPNDRVVMSFMNAMNQSSTAMGRDTNPDGKKIEPIGVGMAHMSLGGYTQDDAFVVSKEFAESNMIRGKDGELRPLEIGDKICDHSGNKGVISFVADKNADMSYYDPEPIAEGMSPEECKFIEKRNDEKEQQRRVIEVFKENPTLDVIGAPYTAPSRFNGGTARELIDSQGKAKEVGMPTDLVVNGKIYEGSIGYARIIVTDMPVDEKTHIYGSGSRSKEDLTDDVAPDLVDENIGIEETGGGRKASGQMVWGLAEMNASSIIREIYRNNENPLVKAREMMLATGLDISETGEIHRGYTPHQIGVDENNQPVYEERQEVSIRDAFNACHKDSIGEVNNNQVKEYFTKAMGEDGGFMKLPFPIKMATGDMTPEILDENGNGTGEYRLPVLAGKFRSGRETVDNSLVMHEYTSRYKDIFDASIDYLKNAEKLEHVADDGKYHYTNSKGEENVIAGKTLTDNTQQAQERAQKAYSAIADDIMERQFTGKHNVWKDDVMRKELKDTATAVISPDPTLDLNKVRMSAKMAIALGIVKEDTNIEEFNKNAKIEDKIVIGWRDPLLSGGGERAFEAEIVEDRPGRPGYDPNNPNNGLVGVQINPSAATSFEGDFDGDSMGYYKPKGKAAIREAKEMLSYQAQLLNREMGNPGEHAAYFQDGLDVAAGVYRDAEKGGDIGQRMKEATKLMNVADLIGDRRVSLGSGNYRAFEMFNEAMHDAHREAFGHDVISYKDPKSHIESLFSMTEEGAKGSISKLIKGYAPYFGCKFEIDENTHEITSFDDSASYATPEARMASMSAGHAKACLTGVAGKFSQHAEMLALNFTPESTARNSDFIERKNLHHVMDLIEQGCKVEPIKAFIEVDEIVDGNKTGNKVKQEINTWKPVVARDEQGNELKDKNGNPMYERMDYIKEDENGKPYVNEEAKSILAAVKAKANEIDSRPTFSASAAATALTHSVTQSVMQLKHDTGPEIMHKIAMIQDVAPALWAGYKIEKCVDEETGEPSWRVSQERDANGRINTIPASPEEWKTMLKDFYEDKHGLNVGTPNPEHVETMAKIMTVDGRDANGNPCKLIEGFDTKTKKILESETALTRLAYEGTFNTLVEYADKKANLFEGAANSYIAPQIINDNKREATEAAKNADYVPQYKGFAAKDTRCKDGEISRLSVDAMDAAMQNSGSDIHIKKDTLEIDVSDEPETNDTAYNQVSVVESESVINAKSEPIVETKIEAEQAIEAKSETMDKTVQNQTSVPAVKHFSDMSIDERLDTIKSFVRKQAQGDYEKNNYSTAEREVAKLYVEQKSLYASLGNRENVDKYEAQHPGAFDEYRTATDFFKAEREARDARPALDKLSADEYENVARSVATAYMNPANKGRPVFSDENEVMFNERLKEQSMKLDGMSKEEKSQYISEHRDEFKERIICSRIRSEAMKANEASNTASNSARYDTAVSTFMSKEEAAAKKLQAEQEAQGGVDKK